MNAVESLGKIPYQIVHAATAVITPAKPKNAFRDCRARSSGVGIVVVDEVVLLVGNVFLDYSRWLLTVPYVDRAL